MADLPSFSSFPDIFGAQPGTSTSGSKGKEVPSFSSFPEIDGPSRAKESKRPLEEGERRKLKEERRDRDRSNGKEERDRDRNRDRHRDRDRSRDRDRERERDRDRHHRDRSVRDDERRHREKRKRSRSRERDRSKRSTDERQLEKEERRAREREKAAALARPQAVEDDLPWYESKSSVKKATETTSSNPFFVDTVGDKDVLRYHATTSFNAPRYRYDQGGRVLGLSEGLRIVYNRDKSIKGIEVAPLGRSYIPRYSSRPIEGTSRHRTRILMRPSDSAGGDLIQDFLSFGEKPKRKQESDELPAYRAIAKDSGDEAEFAEIQAALGEVSTLEDDIKDRRTEFERRLRASPNDVDGWIQYSTLHLELEPNATATGVDPATKPMTLANAEVTLSVLQRALDADSRNFMSPELHIAFLRAAEAFWPAAKVTERWKNVMRQLSEGGVPEEDMMGIYLAYIEWREGHGFGQTEGSAGGVDEVVEVYVECLERLSDIGRNQEAREENQVYLCLRACLFLKQAGYTERAWAIFQALIEVTFFKPAHLRPPAAPFDQRLWFSGVLQEFEDFWDSEAPRIGDDGAKGWKETHESVEEATVPTSAAADVPSIGHDSYSRWYSAERTAEQAFNLPGRATDLGAAEDDPFHVVLFADVAPFLFPVQTSNARLQLIYAFLNLIGLPFTPPEVPTSSPGASDPHLRWAISQNESLRSLFWPAKPASKRITFQTVGGEPMEPEEQRTLQSPFACPIKSWLSNRGTLFANDTWFRDLAEVDLRHVRLDFARNALNLLRPLIPDPAFVLDIFAFESAISSKGAVKVAKNTLAKDSNNLALWDGYAHLEQQRGKVAAARQVYVTAIQAAEERAEAGGEDAEYIKQDEMELWAAWAAMEWEAGSEDMCFHVLVMAAGQQRHKLAESAADYAPTRPPPVTMLKTKQYYASNLSQSPSHLTLGTLFLYLTDGIETTRDRLEGLTEALPSPQAEETYQLLVRLLHTHTSRHSAPASLFRDVLERAISAFPNNTTFLSLYLWHEFRGRIYGRVQNLVSRSTSTDAGIVPLLWSVWAEAQSARLFWEPGGGGAERVRRALDRGITSKIGRHSPALWILYIEFEILHKRYAAAKALCYRAIAACGGCKDLYLLPFQMREHFTNRELRAVAELMAERGIRMRIPTEEYWEDVETEEEEEDEGEMVQPADYEYGMLRERETLKPY